MNKKFLIILASLIILTAFLVWLFIVSSKPLPGEKVTYNCDNFIDFSKIENANTGDKCRTHVPEGTKVNYSTNPPTFGPHYPSWITKGFYNEPRMDGNLVHSLEHGYVIIWYDCEKKVTGYRLQVVGDVYAQSSTMTQGSEGSPSASLESMPEAFRNGSCDNFKNQIKDVIKKNSNHKLIAMPRVGMDSKVVLTAWDRMEKLNSVDLKKIQEFISAYRDFGPEATNEP